jgi:hypothetical protein
MFFFEKKNQKTFDDEARALGDGPTIIIQAIKKGSP